jgi:hypothetical protein
VKRLVIVLGAWLAACGTTGGDVVTFDVEASGTADASVIDTGLGWHVELTRARLHIGAVYLNLAVPISGSQETNCILPGIYTAEELDGLDVDVLSTTRQSFPSRGTGTNDEARTGEIWLTGGNVNAESDSTVIADIAGTATNATTAMPFSASVTINIANRGIAATDPSQPSQHPICKQRIVSPIPIELRPSEGATLVIAIDTHAWFANVDFTALEPAGAGFVFPDENTNAASQNLFTGIRAAAATFQLSFE